MTAPTTSRTDAFKPEAITPRDRMRPIVLTNEFAVDRLVGLLHEFVAQGALPAL
jgi:hypothetical protein